jgi:CBS domain-containing protein
VTDRDIFNLHMVNAKTAISDLGMGDDMDKWAWEGVNNVMKLYYEVSKINIPKVMVREIMVRRPITAFEKTPVCEAARVMRKNDYGQLPVRDSRDRLRGMLYELDTLVALIG